MLVSVCVLVGAEAAVADLSSSVALAGTSTAKSGRAQGELETTAALAFGDGAFQLDLGPCYSVTGTTAPKGRKGTQQRLLVDDASREAYRAFLTVLAAQAGVSPSPALRDRTRLLLTLNENDTATLTLKTRLSAKKARATSIRAELAGPVLPAVGPPAPEPCRFAGPTSSQPLALTARGEFLAVANPDSDSVSFFDVRPGRGARVAEVGVQDEPNGVAFLPDGSKAYVANTASGTVTVIPTDLAAGAPAAPTLHIPVGAEPYGLALTPHGRFLYVSNARSDSISVIETATDLVIGTIPVPGREPRGLAITNDGDDDDQDELLYVTRFLSPLDPGEQDGADDARTGEIWEVDLGLFTVIGTRLLPALGDTGFLAAGDALARVAPGADFTFPTGAYPNQLNQVALKGDFLYAPNIGASQNGPVRFDVNVQSLLSYVVRDGSGGAGASINLQQAVASQASPAKRFLTVPWAIAFEHADDVGYVVSAASDVVAKVQVDPATGLPAVQNDPKQPDRVLEIPVGRNPRGIVVDAADARAYVMNQVSRDVSVVDLAASPEKVIATLRSADLPEPGTPDHLVHVGRELYNTSIGRFDATGRRQPPLTGRMSKDGWSSCSACHPNGLSDGVVWLFPDGPRRTIAQHADFDASDPPARRILNASAARDEQEDFELNIRNVSGGEGLLVLEDGVTPDPDVASLLPLASGGRRQLTVEGVPAWDALAAYVRFGIRAPISPRSETEPDAIAGRALFLSANCQLCHGGPLWTRSTIFHTPPPDPAQVVDGQLIAQLRNVGTFDPGRFNEIDANAGSPLGAAGYAIPSLLSAFAFEGTLLHGGAAVSFDDVLAGVAHRSAGTGGVDTLSNAADRAKVATFLRAIDAATATVP